jgi:hypothetical protein
MDQFNSEKFEECFMYDDMQLPLLRTQNDYLKDLSDLYDRYLPRAENAYAPFMRTIRCVCDYLINTVNRSYNGLPVDAYVEISKVMNILTEYPLRTFQKNGYLFTRNNDPLELYRMRVVNEICQYGRQDIFHAPYSVKESICSCRYSIPGYPSLYLGTTLKLCHSETEGENNRIKIASRFKLVRNPDENNLDSWDIIDLAINPLDIIEIAKGNTEIIDYRDVAKNYLIWYPLVAAASFIRKNKNEHNFFPSEYIIPQLIFQWFRKNKVSSSVGEQNSRKLCGIRYYSSKWKTTSKLGYNYVFPVSNYSADNPYCSVLSGCIGLPPIFVPSTELVEEAS